MDRNGRTPTGTFAKGHPGGPGRPRYGVTDALRRLADPDEIARFLIRVATSDAIGMFSAKDRLHACEMILDRLEGKPTTSAIIAATVTATERPMLPGNWATLTSDERKTWLAANAPLALGPGA